MARLATVIATNSATPSTEKRRTRREIRDTEYLLCKLDQSMRAPGGIGYGATKAISASVGKREPGVFEEIEPGGGPRASNGSAFSGAKRGSALVMRGRGSCGVSSSSSAGWR